MSQQKPEKKKTTPNQNHVAAGYTSDAPRQLLSSEQIEPDEVLSDRYEIGNTIASAPGRLVCRAHDKIAGHEAVLKISRESKDVEGTFTASLKNEARVAEHAGHHPNILTYFSLDRLQSIRGDTLLALATELAPDGSLRNLYHRDGPDISSPKEALAVIRQVCAALAHLHDKGILHLDLKPENILLFGKTGKLADFESSLIPASKKDIAANGQEEEPVCRRGTSVYMAPERFVVQHTEELGPTADIYSLGIMLYELIDSSGRPPWTGSARYIRSSHLREDPLRGSSFEPATIRIISKCLQKDPSHRYQSIDELLPDLDAMEQELLKTDESCTHNHAPCAEAKAEADAIYLELGQSVRDGDIEEMLELLNEAESIYPSHPKGRLTSLRLGRRVRAFSDSITLCAKTLASGDLAGALWHVKDAALVNPESTLVGKLIAHLEPKVIEAALLKALKARDFDQALKYAEMLDNLGFNVNALSASGEQS